MVKSQAGNVMRSLWRTWEYRVLWSLGGWDEGWAVCLSALSTLVPDDLMRIVTVRGEPHTVVEALHRNLAHTSYHVGQMVFLAKAFRGTEWQTLSIPRGGSDAYTRGLMSER